MLTNCCVHAASSLTARTVAMRTIMGLNCNPETGVPRLEYGAGSIGTLSHYIVPGGHVH